jgi:hypothetical protein
MIAKSQKLLPFMVAGLGLGLSACELSDEGGDAEADAEACEHFMTGQVMPFNASPTPDLAGPSVDDDHSQWLITVPGGGEGYVTFRSPGPTEFIFYLTQNVQISFTDTSEPPTNFPIEASATTSAACPNIIRGRHEIMLPTGLYFVKLGPTTVSEVGIVIEEAGAHQADLGLILGGDELGLRDGGRVGE